MMAKRATLKRPIAIVDSGENMNFENEPMLNIRPSDSKHASMHLLSKFKFACLELFENYGRKLEHTAQRWAQRLIDSDVSLAEIKRGIDQVVLTCEKMPSYAEFITVIRNNSNRKNEAEQKEEETAQQSKTMYSWTKKTELDYIETLGEERLNALLKQYFIGAYGHANLDDFGMSYRLFMPIFLKDMKMTNNNLENAIARAKHYLQKI